VDPVWALRQIAFQLGRAGAPTYRVRAFRRAAAVTDGLPAGGLPDEAARRRATVRAHQHPRRPARRLPHPLRLAGVG